jgi:Protein of unknown function (DUF1592)/Protein of unknown function (DUF1588)
MRASVVWLVMALGGCSGEILVAAHSTRPGDDSRTSVPALKYSCGEAQRQQRSSANPHVRRLSQAQLRNTLAALLGPIAADPEIASRLAGLPSDETVIAGDFAEAVPADEARVLYEVAKRAAALALSNAAWRKTNLGGCAATGAPDDACLSTVLATYGARVLRRSPTTAELASLTQFYHSVGGDEAALGFVLRRLLQSPQLAFHLELGDPSTDSSGRTQLTHFELAEHLSYQLTDSMPDAELFELARTGQLSQPTIVEAQARRLLDTPAGHAKVRDFFRYYSHVAGVADPSVSLAAAHHLQREGLGAAMQQEAFDFFEHVLWKADGDFTELLTSTESFAKSAALQQVFDAQPGSHPGLFHRPALLSVPTDRTSPIQRGAHLRKLFLCDNLGMPDPALVQARQTQVGDLEALSTREKTASLTNAPECLGCHRMINPVGYTFEGYDPAGFPREREELYGADGGVSNHWPLDTTASALEFDPGDSFAVSNSRELAQRLAQGVKAGACFSQRLVEYTRLRAVDVTADACTLSETERATHTGTLQDVVIASMANDDLFFTSVPAP